MVFIKAGTGINVGNDFTRLTEDTPIEIDTKAYKRRSFDVVGTIAGQPDSKLGFMRSARVRVLTELKYLVVKE